MTALQTSIRGLLDQAYAGPAWHGPHLRAAVRGVSPAVATYRPRRGRPCLWEIMLHCAYWKHRVRQRILGTDEPFARPGGDWPAAPARPDARQWRADVALLAREHRALLATLATLSPRALARPSRGHRQTPHEMLVGIALHDTYHAGQIRALRKLSGEKR